MQNGNSINKPPCKIIRINEPDLKLMAQAFSMLYHQTKNIDKLESVENR